MKTGKLGLVLAILISGNASLALAKGESVVQRQPAVVAQDDAQTTCVYDAYGNAYVLNKKDGTFDSVPTDSDNEHGGGGGGGGAGGGGGGGGTCSAP